jgi:hypothetical protein
MARGIVIKLTNKQIDQLSPLRDKLLLAEKPGMVLAQIFDNHMDAGFVSYEKSIKLQKIMNRKKVGKVITTAYDKEK